MSYLKTYNEKMIPNGVINSDSLGNYIKPESGIPKSDLSEEVQETLESVPQKQETLVSGENIRTINNESILGEGNIAVTAQTYVIDNTPEADSNNLVKSGGVAREIVWDVTARNSNATFASLSALLSDANLATLIPTTIRRGGMQIRFVHSNDNKYVQYMYKVTDAATVATFTNVANWEKIDIEKELVQLAADMGELQLFQGGYSSSTGSMPNIINVASVVCTKQIYKNKYYRTKSGFYIRGIYYYGSDNKLLSTSSIPLNATEVTIDKIGTGGITSYCLTFNHTNGTDILPTEDVLYNVYDLTEDLIVRTKALEVLPDRMSAAEEEIQSINEVTGWVKDGFICPNGSPAYTLMSMPFNFEQGKRYGVKITYPQNISYRTILSVRTANKAEISGMTSISDGTSSRYVEFTCTSSLGRLLCLSLRTPATEDVTFGIDLYSLEEGLYGLIKDESDKLANLTEVDANLKYALTKDDLIQGSYFHNNLTVYSDRVSSHLMIIPQNKKIAVDCSNDSLAKIYRIQLFNKNKEWLSETDFTEIPNYDVSSVEGAYYFRLVHFGNGVDETPESCDGIFAIKNYQTTFIGNLSSLGTENKTDLVSAINEVLNKEEESLTTASNELFNTVINDYADFRLLLFTDPHTFDKKHYQLYKRLYDMGFLDCVLGLGDITPYVDMPIAECVEGLTEMMTAAGRTKNNLYGVGNHDVGVTLNWEQNHPGCGPINNTHITTKRNQYDFFARHLQDEIHRDPNDPYNVYYYKDFDYAKVRIIMLNASDIYDNNALEYRYQANTAYHQEQVDWLVNTALDLSSKGADITNWHIIVCTHTFNGYDFVRNILVAAHNGAAINSTTTIYNRMQYDSATENYKPDPEHTEGGITLSVNHTFSTPLKIIAFRGHDHFDYLTSHDGLKVVEFYCDNGHLFHPFVTEVAAMPLVHYFFTTHGNHRYGFEVTELYQDAAYVCYNGYFAYASYCEVSVLDSDYNVLQKWNAQELANDADLTGYTELTDFEDAVKNEADKRYFSVVCLNKVENTIKTFPFSWGGHREISI